MNGASALGAGAGLDRSSSVARRWAVSAAPPELPSARRAKIPLLPPGRCRCVARPKHSAPGPPKPAAQQRAVPLLRNLAGPWQPRCRFQAPAPRSAKPRRRLLPDESHA